jgi:hypothetical protein
MIGRMCRPFVCIALLASAAARAQDPAPARGSMTVTLLEGSATATAKGATEARQLFEGFLLAEGDVIQTRADAKLEVLMGSGTILRFGPSTRSELTESPSTGGVFRLKLVAGNFWAHVAKLLGTDKFEIETENGVSGVRGTEFRMETGTAGNPDLIRCYDGAVEVKAPDGKWSQRVEPGRELTFHRLRGSGGPRRFDPNSERRNPFMSWVRKAGPRAHPIRRRAPEKKRTPGVRPTRTPPNRTAPTRTPPARKFKEKPQRQERQLKKRE